jgi:hypothetical protein
MARRFQYWCIYIHYITVKTCHLKCTRTEHWYWNKEFCAARKYRRDNMLRWKVLWCLLPNASWRTMYYYQMYSLRPLLPVKIRMYLDTKLCPNSSVLGHIIMAGGSNRKWSTKKDHVNIHLISWKIFVSRNSDKFVWFKFLLDMEYGFRCVPSSPLGGLLCHLLQVYYFLFLESWCL